METTNENNVNVACGTITEIPDILFMTESMRQQMVTQALQGTIYFRIFFHVVKYSDGSGNENPNLNNLMTILNNYYEDYDIGFVLAGSADILNDTYAELTSGLAGELMATNRRSRMINGYLLPNDVQGWGGIASGIPSTAFIVGRSNFTWGQTTIAHEIGHCLGLYHPHHGIEPGGCAETPANCEVCGDFVCDTPADPNIGQQGFVNGLTCAYTGPAGFNPLTNNIMSYSHDHCRAQFTQGQNARIRQVVESSLTMRECLFEIAGLDHICNVEAYNIPQLANASYVWSVGPGLQIVSSGTGTIAAVESDNLVNSSTLSVTISGLSYFPSGLTITKTIRTKLTQELITFQDIANKFAVPICPNQTIMVTLLYNGQTLQNDNPYGIVEVEWGPAAPGLSLGPTTGHPSLLNGSSCYITRGSGQLSGGHVSVHLKDNCGNGNRTGQYITFVNC